MPDIASFVPPQIGNEKKKESQEFNNFIKQNKEEIDKLKKDFPKATKAGIKDLLFIMWLLEGQGDSKKIFSKTKRLLSTLFATGWIGMLSSFKLVGDLFNR